MKKLLLSLLVAISLNAKADIQFIGQAPSAWATNAWTYSELDGSLVFVGNTYPMPIPSLSWGWELIFAATFEDANNYWNAPFPTTIGCPVVDMWGNSGESLFHASVSVWTPQTTFLVVALNQTLDVGAEGNTAVFELGPIWKCGTCALESSSLSTTKKGHNKQ